MNGIVERAPELCLACGARFDAQHFDAVGFVDAPAAGQRIVITRFELPRQFCGVLEGFQQLASAGAGGGDVLETRGIEWQLRVDGRPLDPYLAFRAVLNRWGEAPLRLAIRLDEGNLIELVAIGVGPDRPQRLGGRLMGRYWFNEPHGRARAR